MGKGDVESCFERSEAGGEGRKTKDNYFEVLHAPYVKGFYEGLQRKLRRLHVG